MTAPPTSLVLRHDRGETRLVYGAFATAAAADQLGDWTEGRTLFVVSDERVLELWGAALAPLEARAARTVRLVVSEGEAAKTIETARDLWRRMLEAGGKRDSRVVGFGGGSVGDLAGFVAGCFLRGVSFATLPTTLLAQVDAAIGGKTGVDLPEGKNTVGLFHQPTFVVADPRWLGTLSRAARRSGLAEVVKVAFLLDPDLFALAEARLPALLDGDSDALTPVVVGAARAKIAVVEADPYEADRRRLLNFGHTLGHALETTAAYRGLAHGDAVAWGLRFALRLARRLGHPVTAGSRLDALLDRFDLPPFGPVDPEALLATMARDKKARETGLVWVLPRGIGDGVCEVVGWEVVREELRDFVASDE